MNTRIYFRVSRKGYARDEAGFEYHLPKSLEHLNVGDRLSVPSNEAPDGDRIAHTANLVVESGDFSELKLSGERKRFESAAQETTGWTPRTGDPTYSGARSDSGRFSHPRDPGKRQ